ncbi:hypothetical protein F2P81_017075 [Scophthalmus maximus]|uniref:Uncharacterized protein n=1 Tax=Scophthalmus maximus TaxID=52904 RepID=A0A6A4SHF2_SCOMX|nr:hypothetical protein F2P81_017075 [Scophthalmus maximus]
MLLAAGRLLALTAEFSVDHSDDQYICQVKHVSNIPSVSRFVKVITKTNVTWQDIDMNKKHLLSKSVGSPLQTRQKSSANGL